MQTRIVKDEIAHILHHVNAEISDQDKSQAPGILDRAQKVKDLLDPLNSDNRKIDREAIIALLITRQIDPTLKMELQRLDTKDEGQKLRHSITAWVRTGDMLRG